MIPLLLFLDDNLRFGADTGVESTPVALLRFVFEIVIGIVDFIHFLWRWRNQIPVWHRRIITQNDARNKTYTERVGEWVGC